ncbi:MAG TPA: GNAT family N-acetyltransferase [Myxococcales bacterium]|jgi:long-subunit acyl-CoA synthetase (AMP-forming)
MSPAPLLTQALDRWESAPSPDRAAELLQAAEAALASGGVAPAIWHRWLDATRKRDHLLALPDRETRSRWADAAVRVVSSSDYDLARMLAQRVASHPDRTLFVSGPGPGAPRWSYAQIARRTDAIAAALLRLEAEPVVAIVSENGLDSACVDLACLLHGVVVAPLSPHLTAAELAAAFGALGVNLVFAAAEETVRRLREIAGRVARPFRIVLLDDAAEHAGEGDLVLGEALAGQDEAAVAAALERAPRRALAETCTVLFTSGSTGGQKGVCFSMENLVTKRFARAAALPFVGEEEVLLCYLPLYHTFGRFLEMLGTLFWGGTYVFAQNPSLDGLAAGLREVEPTGLISIPIRWAQLEARAREAAGEAASPEAARDALRKVVGGRLRWGLSAAGYLAPQVFRFFQGHGVELCSGFGMTEATGGITMTPPGEYEEGSVGLPLPGIRVRLGEQDELEISGPYVGGYLGEGAPAPGEERWVKTGDVFRRRESGHLEIVDRVKDIYKNSRGRTVAPRRVEQRFEGVPGVLRVFLVGDGRDDNVLLVVPDADDPVLCGNAQGNAAGEYLRSIVAAANRDLAPYERVVDFAVLSRDFSLEFGELTPKGSYRRKAIEKAFTSVIESLYRSRGAELSDGVVTASVPRWIYRDLALLEGDLALEGGRLVDRRRGRSAALAPRPGSDELRIGSLTYRCPSRRVDLGLLARQPLLWVGNAELAALLPLKEGWDTPLGGSCAELLLPPRAEVPEGEPALPPEPLPSPQLTALHRLSLTLLFGPADAALAAVARAEVLLRQADKRTAELLRRRLQALARHPDERVRCETYRVLLLDDPLVDTGEILPAFLRSGLSFLSEESVAAIAHADLGEERLTALRRRLHSYREALAAPVLAATRQTLGDILELLAGFARHHPEDHAAVRAELASWALQGTDGELARRAETLFDELGAWFQETSAAAAVPIHPGVARRKLCFRDGLPEEEERALEALLLGTSFLRESIALAFETDPPDLADIPDEGIWVTPVLSLHRYRLYRVSVRTAAGAHHDLLLTVRSDLDSAAVRLTTLRMITLAGHPGGTLVVPRVGACRPDLGALSVAWVNELTLAERLRDAEVPGRTWSGDAPSIKGLVVRALEAFFRAWDEGGRAFVPGAVAPSNVAVPAEDYREGACLLSLSGSRPYRGPRDLVEPMLRNFFRETAALSPRLGPVLRPGWIVDAAFEALGEDGARAFLGELGASWGPVGGDAAGMLLCAVESALAVAPGGRVPFALEAATAKFEAWEEARPDSPLAERERTAEALLRLYRVDALGQEARFRLWRATVFARSRPGVLRSFDELLAAMRARPGTRPSHLVELEGLHSALETDEERHVFTHLFFPAARTSRPVEVTVVGDAVKHVVVATELVDRQDAAWIVREPVDAAEVGRLYRLFVRAGLPRAFSQERRYLVILDSASRIAGGASFSLLGTDLAQLDGLVITPALRGRGLSSALVDDLCARLAALGVKSVQAHFAFSHIPLSGFRLDRRHGGLVRDLVPAEGEAFLPRRAAAAPGDEHAGPLDAEALARSRQRA